MEKKSLKHHFSKTVCVLLFFIFLYISYFTYFTFTQHDLFLTGRYDLGNMDQTVWNTLHGRIFYFINPDFDEPMSRLSVHSDFILILLAPFYLIWNSAKMLLLIQTVVLGLGAVYVYAIGKKVLNHQLLPLAFALSYLLNPFLEWQNIFDFHPVSLATTFLLATFYYMQGRKYIRFFIALLLAVLTKEHIFLIAGLFGLYLFFIQKKRWGILITIISLTIFYILIAILIPQARGGDHFALGYYKDLGDSPLTIIQNFVTNPLKVFQIIWSHNILTYLFYLFLPVGFLSILSPLTFVFALPEFFVNALSNDSALRSYYYHYAAASIPFIYISSIYAIQKLRNKLKYKKISIVLFIYIVASALFSAWLFGPLPGAQSADLVIYQQEHDDSKIIQSYLRTISRQTPVAATNNLAAHLMHRQNIYSPQTGVTKADTLVFLVPDLHNTSDKDVVTINQLYADPNFHLEYQLDNFLVFKRNK